MCVWVNNITTCDDGDVVRRIATNIFFKLIMLDFFGLLCVGVRWGEVRDLLGKKHKC